MQTWFPVRHRRNDFSRTEYVCTKKEKKLNCDQVENRNIKQEISSFSFTARSRMLSIRYVHCHCVALMQNKHRFKSFQVYINVCTLVYMVKISTDYKQIFSYVHFCVLTYEYTIEHFIKSILHFPQLKATGSVEK